MKQSELTTELAFRTKLSQAQAKDVVSALAEIITEQLKKGETVVLHGSLGAFKVEGKPERKGRNPSNGESIMVPAKIKPSFQVSKTLKDALN